MNLAEFKSLTKKLLASEEDDRDNYIKVKSKYSYLRFLLILDLHDTRLYSTKDKKFFILNECGISSLYKAL